MVVILTLIVSILLNNVWLLAVTFVARGVQGAGFDIGWQTSVTSMARPEKTSALTTSFLVALGVRGLVVPFIGAALLEAVGSIGTLAIALGVGLLGAFLMLRVIRAFVPVSEDPDGG